LTLYLHPRPRGREINGDPRTEFLARVTESLGGGWLERRRVVSELEHHLEDCVADLREAGVPEEAAVRDAMARLGDVDTIVTAVRATRSTRRLSWPGITRVAIAWIAVGAMSIVTLAAVELPQASGAKVTGVPAAASTHVAAGDAISRRHEHSRAGHEAKHRTHLRITCRCSRDVARDR
jgi:hypothetical protein